MSALTFYFKDIFPTWESFQQFLEEYQVWGGTPGTVTAETQNLLYKYLFREYMNSNIQYDTPEEFKADFATVFEQHMQQFQKQFELINKTYALTADEITLIGQRLQNIAVNPNSAPVNPGVPLEYVTDQTYEKMDDGRIKAFLDAITRMPSLRIRDFVDKFKKLFKTTFYNQKEYYEE